MEWVVSATPLPLFPLQRPCTHCIVGRVGPRTGLSGYGKSQHPTGIRSQHRPACKEPLYRLSYPGPRFNELPLNFIRVYVRFFNVRHPPRGQFVCNRLYSKVGWIKPRCMMVDVNSCHACLKLAAVFIPLEATKHYCSWMCGGVPLIVIQTNLYFCWDGAHKYQLAQEFPIVFYI